MPTTHQASPAVAWYLLLGVTVSALSPAISCCGTLDLGWDEHELWAMRADMCQDVSAHQTIFDTYEVRRQIDGYTMILDAYDSGEHFGRCWDAYEEIITKCMKRGSAVGTWQHGAELYSVDVTSMESPWFTEEEKEKRMRSRGTTNLTIDSVNMAGDTIFVLDDQMLQLSVTNPNFAGDLTISNADRHGLTTVYETDQRTALVRAVKASGRSLIQSESLACDSNGRDMVAVIRGGFWRSDWQSYGACVICPPAGTGSCGIDLIGDKTTYMTMIPSLGRDAAGLAITASRAAGIPMRADWISNETVSCSWDAGRCHQPMESISMAWSEGYIVKASRIIGGNIIVRATYFHADGPVGEHLTTCDTDCCVGTACRGHPGVDEGCPPLHLGAPGLQGVPAACSGPNCKGQIVWQHGIRA